MSRKRTHTNKNKSVSKTNTTQSAQDSKSRDPKLESTKETAAEKERPDVDKEGNRVPGRNDPEWFNRDPRVLTDAASVPYSEPFGAKITLHAEPERWGSYAIDDTAIQDNSVSTPGILTAIVEPSYGEASDRLSPANVAATALYSHVRYVNNGRKNYDPADLFMYVSSVAELYAFLNYTRRIYGSALIYSQVNRYVGKALLTAQGVDPDTVVNNLANVRYWINMFTNKISSYAVPADITLFYKRAFQFSSIYVEHEGGSIKDQLYLYRPKSFYRFRLDDRKLGMLERLSLNEHTPNSWDDIAAYGESLLEFIFGDEDFGLMSGDVMRAFNGKILSLESLPEDYTAFIKFDPYVLHQFENATITSTVYDAYKSSDELGDSDAYYQMVGDPDQHKYQFGHVYQDGKGNIISQHAVLEGSYFTSQPNNSLVPLFDKVISIHAESGDIGLTIESVQNMVPYYANNNVTVHTVPTSQESEFLALVYPGASYIRSVDVYYYNYSNVLTNKSIRQALPKTVGGEAGHVYAQTIWDIKYFNFKYGPRIYAFAVDPDPQVLALQELNILSNVDTYAIVTNAQVRRMLEVSLVSLLYVPGVAKLTNALGESK